MFIVRLWPYQTSINSFPGQNGTPTEMGYVMEFTETALARVGVRIMNNERLWLQCRRCHQGWPVQTKSAGKLPPHYWRCPNGCNAGVKAY